MVAFDPGRPGASASAHYPAVRRAWRVRMVVTTVLILLGASFVGLAIWSYSRDATWRAAWAGTGIVVALAGWTARPQPDPERWLRGAAGEAATAALLSRLPARRWAVLHDLRVPGSRANIDHLLVGPTGVWVVDTKTTRGLVRSRWRSVRLGEHRLDVEPVRWEAAVVADRLGIAVRPLVVVHGVSPPRGGLPIRGRRVRDVRVVPAAGLIRRVRRGRYRLRADEVAVLAGRCGAAFAPAGARWARSPPARRAAPPVES